MKFVLKYREEGDLAVREETYDKEGVTEANVNATAEGYIEYWNNTLNPHDIPREFVSAEIVGLGVAKPKHKWSKLNLTTIVRGTQVYDTMRCDVCGVTGKRHGIQTHVRIDSKYRAKKYQDCIETNPK